MDLVIVEPADVDGRPVPPGVRSDKIYVTNLWNHALPLIRYEVTDQIELLDLDDHSGYGPVAVHPSVFRSPLGRRREIVEYQVRQTPAGAAIAVRATGPLDTAALAAEITAELARLGVPAPRVDVEVVDALPRPASGKLVRFVALPAGR